MYAISAELCLIKKKNAILEDHASDAAILSVTAASIRKLAKLFNLNSNSNSVLFARTSVTVKSAQGKSSETKDLLI